MTSPTVCSPSGNVPASYASLHQLIISSAIIYQFNGGHQLHRDYRNGVHAACRELLNQQDHYWSEYRNFGGPAVASTGYGLVAIALAEATGGRLVSWDSAFDGTHEGETAEQFLTWWGNEQIGFYGVEPFKQAQK